MQQSERFPFLGLGEYPMVIGDRKVTSRTLRPTYDPATGAEIGRAYLAGPEEVDQAVSSAQNAFRAWSRMPAAQREKLMHRYADAIEENAEELALIDTLDNGAPLSNTRGGVARAVEQMRYYAGWATKITGETIAPSRPHDAYFAYTLRQPVGVVAAITPWNSPVVNMMLKVTAALAAGCAVVVKPSELTPLSALRLAELALDAGLPPGLVCVIPGDGAVAGQALAEHRGIAKVSFTGSTEVGRKIVDAAKNRMARLTLELGGKSPNIVFDDVDIDTVVPQAAWATFRNSGQICVAGSRLFVQAKIYDAFLERLATFTRSVKVGNGLDPESQMGPLISGRQADRVEEYVNGGVADGATLIAGGRRLRDAERPTGQFFEPTVIADVRPDIRIVREEVFGPVTVVSRFDGIDEAIEAANRTEYGLAAGLWTGSLSTAHRVAANVHAGMIWVNCYGQYDPALPFGGHKLSGVGAKSGHEAVLDCTELKTVVMSLGGESPRS